jgi:predicted nucleic acid-binding protein
MGSLDKQLQKQLQKQLAKMQGARVYFDTNILIYVLENSAGYVDVCLPFFEAIADHSIIGCTGEITIAELLVQPIATNNLLGIQHIKALFASDAYFQTAAHDRETLELAAYIRATQKLKMIDAIHTATAIQSQCPYMLTHDKQLARRVNGVEIVNINQFLPDALQKK